MHLSRRNLTKLSLVTGAVAAPLGYVALTRTDAASSQPAPQVQFDATQPAVQPTDQASATPAPAAESSGTAGKTLPTNPASKPVVLLNEANVTAPRDVTLALLAGLVGVESFTATFTFTTTSLAQQTLLSVSAPQGPEEFMWIGLEGGKPSLLVARAGRPVVQYSPSVALADGASHTLTARIGKGVAHLMVDGSSVGLAALPVGLAKLSVSVAQVRGHSHMGVPHDLPFDGTLHHVHVQAGALELNPLPGSVVMAQLAKLRSLTDSATPVKWLFTGDSLTHGCEATEGWRGYVQHFEERQRFERLFTRHWVFSTGISGSTCRDVLGDFDWRVREHRPHVVSFMIGMNDFRDGLARLPQFRAEIDAFIARTRTLGAEVLLQVSPPQWKDAVGAGVLHAYNECVREVGFARRVPVIDHSAHFMLAGGGTAPTAWYFDYAHPRGYGHYQMAERLMRDVGVYGKGKFASGYAYPESSVNP